MIHRILEDSASQGDEELEKMCKEVAATMYVGECSNYIVLLHTSRPLTVVLRSPSWGGHGECCMVSMPSAGRWDSWFFQSNAMMGAFFLAMALHPEVQKKAQQELDAVVGTERLPDFSDRPSLPYVTAIAKELLRWHPAAPTGVPHRSIADDEYNGHFIPGGSTIFVNIWCVHGSSVETENVPD